MNKSVILSLILVSGTAQAGLINPVKGEKAHYKLTVNEIANPNDPDFKHTDSYEEVTDVADEGFVIQASWGYSHKDPLVFAPFPEKFSERNEFENMLLQCDTIEPVTVPAGTYSACHLTEAIEADDGETYYAHAWYVPGFTFSLVKGQTRDASNEKVLIEEVLQSYTKP